MKRHPLSLAMLLVATAASAGSLFQMGATTAHQRFSDPTSGKQNYRGGPGNRAAQRAALKRRNQQRHRKACRG